MKNFFKIVLALLIVGAVFTCGYVTCSMLSGEPEMNNANITPTATLTVTITPEPTTIISYEQEQELLRLIDDYNYSVKKYVEYNCSSDGRSLIIAEEYKKIANEDAKAINSIINDTYLWGGQSKFEKYESEYYSKPEYMPHVQYIDELDYRGLYW